MTYLLASLYNETQSNRGLLLKKRICSTGSKFFPLRDGLVVQGDKYDTDKVVSHESVPINLKSPFFVARIFSLFCFRKIRRLSLYKENT